MPFRHVMRPSMVAGHVRCPRRSSWLTVHIRMSYVAVYARTRRGLLRSKDLSSIPDQTLAALTQCLPGHMPASACTHKGVHELTHGSSRHLLARLAHDRWHEVSSPWQQLLQHLPAGSISELGAPGHALPQALDRVSEGEAHVIASERAQHEDSAERCYAACQRSASDDGQDHLRPR